MSIRRLGQYLNDRLHYVDRFWRLYRYLLRPKAFRHYLQWLAEQSSETQQAQPLVVFDFSNARIDGPQGRRFFTLFMYFVRAGYYPVFIARYLFLVTMQAKTKRFCLQWPFSVVASYAEIKKPYVLVTDRAGDELPAGCIKRICIDFRPDYIDDREGVPLPFSMFPGIYAQNADLTVDELAQRPKPWRVFFGGDAEPGKYAKASIRFIYKKVPRGEVLERLRQGLPADVLSEPKQQPEFDALLEQSFAGVLLMNTRYVKVPSEKWLETVARSAFFLACPGVRYPMSHNLIEAMAVGSIPITEYPELFFPALQDGVNCLVYSGRNDLVQTVERALRMDEAEVQALAAGAREYYQQHLQASSAVQAMLDEPGDCVNLRLLPFLRRGGGYA